MKKTIVMAVALAFGFLAVNAQNAASMQKAAPATVRAQKAEKAEKAETVKPLDYKQVAKKAENFDRSIYENPKVKALENMDDEQLVEYINQQLSETELSPEVIAHFTKIMSKIEGANTIVEPQNYEDNAK